MLVILTGGDDQSVFETMDEIRRRADFELVVPEQYDIDTLYNGPVGHYKPGTGEHLLTLHHHWYMPIHDGTLRLTPDFKQMELFLASRGAVSAVLPTDKAIDHLVYQAMTELTETSPAGIVAVARNREAEVQPLDRWRHYIGSPNPKRLVVARPDRKVRREIVESTDDDFWQDIGIASSASSADELEMLWMTLGAPEIEGRGKLPPHVESWVATNGGEFIP